jgi:hypothetical protein
MKSFESKGIWWLPDNKESYITGILKFNPEDGAYLELMGQLSGYEELEANIILGKTSDGKNITLYKCFEVIKTFNSSGFPTTVVFANITFEGVHFNTEEDIKFKELSCHYSNLDEWAWMNGIQIDKPTSDKLEISYKLPPKISAEIKNDYVIEVYPSAETPSHCIVQKEATIIQRIYVKVINNKLNSFEEHRDKLHHMQNFISLGVGEPVTIIDVIGETEENKEDYDGNILYPKVTIYFCIKKSLEDYKPILPPNMLFNLKDIKDDFNIIINKWYDREEVLKPVFNLYFGTLYNSDMYLEQKFSSLIQAIESYHRRTKNNNEIEPEEHEKRINNIIESVDAQYKKWLEGKLAYSNEPTLRNRLKELLEECGSLLKLSSSKKKKSFIGKICDTRNYFTHYDISLAGKAAKGTELLRLCNMLKVIIEFNLLLEIGFDNKKAQELLEEKYKRYNIFE